MAPPKDLSPATLTLDPPVIRMRTLTRLRWFAIVGQLLVTVSVRFGLGYELPVVPILAAIAVGAWVNLHLTLTVPPAEVLSPGRLARHLGFDTLQIGTVLFFTGGIQNPFAVWLILPAMLAAASLNRARAGVVLAMVVLALSLLTFWHEPLPWQNPEGYNVPFVYDLGTWVALLLGVAFTFAYAHQVAMDQAKLSAALEATQKALAREEQLTALGGLAAAAAHELGTPLGTIQVTAKEMQRELPEGPLREDAALLISQTQRCQRILHRLSQAVDIKDERHSILSLEEVMREAAKPFLENTPIEVEFTFDPDCQSAAPEALRRMPEVIYGLRTLVENAVKFASATVRLTAWWDREHISITIEDDGPGFPPEVQLRLGEPYPRAEPPRGGQGLGLGFFIAKTLLERTGAHLRFGNHKRLPGAFVEVSWPLANLTSVPISQESH